MGKYFNELTHNEQLMVGFEFSEWFGKTDIERNLQYQDYLKTIKNGLEQIIALDVGIGVWFTSEERGWLYTLSESKQLRATVEIGSNWPTLNTVTALFTMNLCVRVAEEMAHLAKIKPEPAIYVQKAKELLPKILMEIKKYDGLV
jgi:hypothetical protein